MKFGIYTSFIFLILYAISVLAGFIPAALFLFSISPLVVIFAVYKILKDPKEASVTFEESFYQDGSHPRVKSTSQEDPY